MKLSRPIFPRLGGRHVAHFQVHQDYQEDDPTASFHITLDIETAAVSEPDWDTLPHEMHRIRRHKDDGTIVVTPLPDQYLSTARDFIDRLYGWGGM